MIKNKSSMNIKDMIFTPLLLYVFQVYPLDSVNF